MFKVQKSPKNKWSLLFCHHLLSNHYSELWLSFESIFILLHTYVSNH